MESGVKSLGGILTQDVSMDGLHAVSFYDTLENELFVKLMEVFEINDDSLGMGDFL